MGNSRRSLQSDVNLQQTQNEPPSKPKPKSKNKKKTSFDPSPNQTIPVTTPITTPITIPQSNSTSNSTKTSNTTKNSTTVPAPTTQTTPTAGHKRRQPEEQPIPNKEESADLNNDPSHSSKNSTMSEPTGVMITDALTDVRIQYHISPKELGHGHYGIVRKCMNRETGEWYAIKSIKKSKVNKIEVLKREIEILKAVDHPNIIRLIEVHEDMKYLHLVTELCTGGELFERIITKTQTEEGHFSESDAAKLVRDILDAINYCHTEKGIVHRDLKPENFLYKTDAEDAPIKIIDFGLSRHDDQHEGIMKTKVGTPYYVAPEVLSRQYTKSCDIWSIGVITYILLCGYPPFYGDSDTQIFSSVRAGIFDFPSPDWDTISDGAKDFICCLLKLDPSERVTAEQALNHKWIMDQCYASITPSNSKQRKISHQNRRSMTFASYMGMEKLKKAALGYIASNLTRSEIGELEQIFQQIDTNRDGLLTLSELDHALTNQNFDPSLASQLIRLRDELDITDDASLQWKDFLTATMDRNLAMQEDKVRSAFDFFRQDGKIYMEMDDLIRMFGSEAQAKEIMGSVDIDNDNRISFEEFKIMMASSNIPDIYAE